MNWDGYSVAFMRKRLSQWKAHLPPTGKPRGWIQRLAVQTVPKIEAAIQERERGNQ